MNRLFTTMLLMGLAVINTTAWAKSISEAEARAIASRFMAGKAMPAANLKVSHKGLKPGSTGESGAAAYYVFSSAEEQPGFVIVAGDDRAPAVLGYSDNGRFDSSRIPEAMQELLKGYAAQIEALGHGARATSSHLAGEAIAPMVATAWSQNAPYNTLLPVLSTGKHAYVGCVATAMAQVMHYHKWPARSTRAIPAYTTETLSIHMPELPVADLEWDAMDYTYQTTDTASAAAMAAARLSLYCAQSLSMDFNNNGSGAWSSAVPHALSTYFGYQASAHTLNRINYTTQQWEEIIYNELAASRPVIYSGSKATGGHSFICDGFDGSGMFHINWGWNGDSNGYFVLNVLNPDAQGTGSASGAYGYIYRQAAVVGIEPGEDNPSEFEVTSVNVTLDNYITTRSSTSSSFWAIVSGQFHNLTSQVIALNYGWGLFQDGQLLEVLSSNYSDALRPSYYYSTKSKALYFGSNTTSGTYQIVPIYSERQNANWRPCVGGDKNYIEVTIDGNNCSFTGYGSAATREYTVNGVDITGNMHPLRPIDITLNVTNDGNSRNDLLHLFVGGTRVSTGLLCLEKGESGGIPFYYVPTAAGTFTLTYSFNDDGRAPIYSHTITVNEMPAATLEASATILNLNVADSSIINNDKFSVLLTITNNGTTAYNEDISIELYKSTKENSGAYVQAKNKFINLAPDETTTVQFDMENVMDGWKYFARTYYYSAGQQVLLEKIPLHTIVFPGADVFMAGDVNDDGTVDVNDIAIAISYLLDNSGEVGLNVQAADTDGNGDVDITDIANIINMILGGGAM